MVDVGHEKIAVKEAKKLAIPVVGVVDTNNSPLDVDYIIPGNDDAIRAINLYANGIAEALIESRQASLQIVGDEDDFVELSENEEVEPATTPEANQETASPIGFVGVEN